MSERSSSVWHSIQRLAAAMPNARFVVLESANHVPVPGEPAWPIFLAEIDAFLRE